jgi:hypothetical protein
MPSTHELQRAETGMVLPLPETAGELEQLHADFAALVEGIDTAYDALQPDQKERLDMGPTGRKWGGDENNQQGWEPA